jgi:hypothetical protein
MYTEKAEKVTRRIFFDRLPIEYRSLLTHLFYTQRGIHEIHEPDVLIAEPFQALPDSASAG